MIAPYNQTRWLHNLPKCVRIKITGKTNDQIRKPADKEENEYSFKTTTHNQQKASITSIRNPSERFKATFKFEKKALATKIH